MNVVGNIFEKKTKNQKNIKQKKKPKNQQLGTLNHSPLSALQQPIQSFFFLTNYW